MIEQICRIIISKLGFLMNDNSTAFGYFLGKEIRNGVYYAEVEGKAAENILFDRVPKEYLENRYYKITCSDIDFVGSLSLNKEMLLSGYLKKQDDISMTQTERNFLFNFIKKIAPRKIMEFSPFHGFSTITIAQALDKNNVDFFETHELEKENADRANFNLYESDIDFVKVITGDVFETLNREKLKEVDFLLIDSDHSGKFAEKYIAEFFPLLKNDCWVAIHDISHDEYFSSEERKVVCDYLKKTNSKTHFHIADLMKMYQIIDDTFMYSNQRNTLLFYQVKK